MAEGISQPSGVGFELLVLMQTVHILWINGMATNPDGSIAAVGEDNRQRPAPQARVTMAQTMPSRPFTESQAARVTDSVEVMRRSCLSRRARSVKAARRAAWTARA